MKTLFRVIFFFLDITVEVQKTNVSSSSDVDETYFVKARMPVVYKKIVIPWHELWVQGGFFLAHAPGEGWVKILVQPLGAVEVLTADGDWVKTSKIKWRLF